MAGKSSEGILSTGSNGYVDACHLEVVLSQASELLICEVHRKGEGDQTTVSDIVLLERGGAIFGRDSVMLEARDYPFLDNTYNFPTPLGSRDRHSDSPTTGLLLFRMLPFPFLVNLIEIKDKLVIT